VIADIEAGAARLSELLDDLLALAREDAAAPVKGEPVRLADLAEDPVIERDVTVLGERPALERAVGNLVRNAHKHGRGRVTVTVGGDGEWAFVRVEDEGPGLSPAEAERAFERFYRGAGARGEGSGLGLAIVRSIAERHGGRVEVDGARFTLVVKELSNSGRRTGAQ
jgi:signal transduction histidine kinase